ncbi:MAG TPA: CDP-glycerol glycerophosphotransferase family protein [Kofleriaceae bacterium]|jgi:hypothetical protein
MSKPRVLVPITIQFSVRYLLRTGLLARLAEFATPIVILGWDDPSLQAEIVALGGEVHVLPATRYGATYTRVRRQIDTCHYARLASATTKVAERRELLDQPLRLRAIRMLRNFRNRAALLRPGFEEHVHEQERSLLSTDTNFREFQLLVRSLRADALLSLTPFHKQEELLVRAAAADHLKLCAAILSFDNVTVRGWIGAIFDSYLVWNRHNREQLLRAYPEAKARRVEVVGAPQFDFYWKPELCWEEPLWRNRLGLPPGRPVILYAGGPQVIVKHEPHIVGQLDDAIERGEIPGNPIILLRRHPGDSSERWEALVRSGRHIVFDEPWKSGEDPKHSNIRDADIAKLVSTLKHSAVHVNVASTMTVDGSVFDRPQVGPAYDDSAGHRYDRMMRELYEHEHFAPITASGGLDIALSRAELVRAVVSGLEHPSARAAGRKSLVQEIITYTDGHSTDRVAAELARCFTGTREAIV